MILNHFCRLNFVPSKIVPVLSIKYFPVFYTYIFHSYTCKPLMLDRKVKLVYLPQKVLQDTLYKFLHPEKLL